MGGADRTHIRNLYTQVNTLLKHLELQIMGAPQPAAAVPLAASNMQVLINLWLHSPCDLRVFMWCAQEL